MVHKQHSARTMMKTNDAVDWEREQSELGCNIGFSVILVCATL